VSRRDGFTLIEMLMVVVIISLTMLIALPQFSRAVNQSNMVSARAKVMASFSAARATAAGSGRLTTFHVSGNRVWVTATPRLKATGSGTRDTIVVPQDLNTLYGVSSTNSVDSVLLDLTGLGRNGSNFVLSHGALRDTIEINRYGRVQK
jgi:prepilin-type N-terminal cleavage/methylation domain-containing protein